MLVVATLGYGPVTERRALQPSPTSSEQQQPHEAQAMQQPSGVQCRRVAGQAPGLQHSSAPAVAQPDSLAGARAVCCAQLFKQDPSHHVARWKLTKGEVQQASGLNKACRSTERWLAPIQPHLKHLAAASSAGTSLEANLKHIAVTLPPGMWPRGTDQRRGRVVLVDEHRTSRVSSAVNGQQPCESRLSKRRATRPANWKPPAGQVHHRLLRPAWSQQHDQPVWGMMWCPVVAPRKPPQPPRRSQAAPQPAASEPGPSTPLPAKRSKRTKAEPEAAEPTKGKGRAAKAKLAPQPGRWLDRDCNAALNMQRIRESKWRPLELCWWPDQGALPAKGKEYPGLGYKRVRDKPPQDKAQPAAAQMACNERHEAPQGSHITRASHARSKPGHSLTCPLAQPAINCTMQAQAKKRKWDVVGPDAASGAAPVAVEASASQPVAPVAQFRTGQVSATVDGKQPCESQLTPPCSQAATQPAASEPGPSTPPPAKRSKRTKAEQAAVPTQPTKGKGKAKGKAAKANSAPQPGNRKATSCDGGASRCFKQRKDVLTCCDQPLRAVQACNLDKEHVNDLKERRLLGMEEGDSLQGTLPPHLSHLAAASSAGPSLVANLKHITVTLATWDAVWEVYVDPKWARQRLRLYGAQDRALEQFFKKLEEDMAELSMERHGRAKQLVVFFGAASIGTAGGRAGEPNMGKGKAAKAKPAPQPGRWLDRDCNAALNMQRTGESRWRPLELCWWPGQPGLPAKGKEYPGLGYKRLRDKPPKAKQQPVGAQQCVPTAHEHYIYCEKQNTGVCPPLELSSASLSACLSCQLYTIALWVRQ
ncbi:hypothetical protein QJQ45_018814 [Haematococcus lacustris]|nr:hypothetical protein QJQ45_018814 [Haematococcus lacustris]